MFDITRIFSVTEIAVFLTVFVLVILVIAGNLVLWQFLKKHELRKLCTRQLQQKREDLLARLEDLRRNGLLPDSEEEAVDAASPEDEEEEEDDGQFEDVDEEEPVSQEVTAEEVQQALESTDEVQIGRGVRILKVSSMTPHMRTAFGLEGEEHDGKSYYARYNYSFEAKLRALDDTVKERYTEIINEIGLYKKVKIAPSLRQVRVYKGRKTLGVIFINGKTLCIAFALNPADYADTKYRGKDMSHTVRFKKTPMVMKLTSSRRVEYAKYLLVQLADKNTIIMKDNPEKQVIDLSAMNDGELFEASLLKITLCGEIDYSSVNKQAPAEQPAVETTEETAEQPAEEATEETAVTEPSEN